VSDNIIVKGSTHHLSQPGVHTLRVWRMDAGVVLQKIVIAPDGKEIREYLGPPGSPTLVP